MNGDRDVILGASADELLDDEARRAVLRERARILAREDAGATAEQTTPVLSFRLGRETYGVETSLIREVYPLTELTPLPCTPPFISGVVNVRGQILTVLDLRRLLGLAQEGITNLNRMVVVQHGESEMGLLTDEILGIADISLSALASAVAGAGALPARFVRAVLSDGLILLDLRALLEDERLVVDEEVQ